MYIRFASTLSAILWSTIAVSAPGQALQPVDKWQLDYGDTQCAAARPYGDAASPIILGIIPSLNQSYYKILVSVPRAGPPYAKEARGTADFGSGPINSEVLYYGKSGVKQSAYQFVLSAADMAKAGAATAVTLKSDRADYTFTLSQLPKLLAGLSKCSADLSQYWNMGAANAAITAGEPVAEIDELLTAQDYPTEAQWLKPRSTNRYQLLVDEKGAVAGCEIVSPSGAQVVDSTGCQLIAGRTKFRPAKDATGKAVRSAWITPPMTWTSGTESSLDSGCRKLSSDGRTLVDMCGRMQDSGMQSGFPTRPTPPPPPPPPPSPPPSH